MDGQICSIRFTEKDIEGIKRLSDVIGVRTKSGVIKKILHDALVALEKDTGGTLVDPETEAQCTR